MASVFNESETKCIGLPDTMASDQSFHEIRGPAPPDPGQVRKKPSFSMLHLAMPVERCCHIDMAIIYAFFLEWLQQLRSSCLSLY